MGRNGPGTRGTHDSPASPNMPAKTPRRQGDPGGGRGVHDTDPPGNGVKPNRTLRPGIGTGGDASFSGKARPSEFSKGDPRRSHS